MTTANTLARFLASEARKASPTEARALAAHAQQLEGRRHFARSHTQG